jgi:zinc transport system ATP-binding protein
VPVVSLSGVRFAYGRGPAVLDGIDLIVERGEFVGVAGPNGGGKTTLMRLIVGLDRPAAGRVELFGSPPEQSHRRSRVGYLPQRATLGLDAPITVRELVTAGRSPLRGPLWPRGAKDRRVIEEAIERVGLSATADRTLQTLSGGQRQRAFIAKLLAGDPELLILDEPTAGVDAPSQESLAALLDRLRRELGVTILYVSHEFGAIEPYVGRLVVVRGNIVFDGPPRALPQHWHDPSHPHGDLGHVTA